MKLSTDADLESLSDACCRPVQREQQPAKSRQHLKGWLPVGYGRRMQGEQGGESSAVNIAAVSL